MAFNSEILGPWVPEGELNWGGYGEDPQMPHLAGEGQGVRRAFPGWTHLWTLQAQGHPWATSADGLLANTWLTDVKAAIPTPSSKPSGYRLRYKQSNNENRENNTTTFL